MSTTPIVHLVTDDEVEGKAKELFENLKTSTGKVPKWMRVMANCDDILVGFFSMFKAIMDDAPLNKELKWKVAYHVSEKNKCSYCVSVSAAQLKSLGMGIDSHAELKESLTDEEKLAIEYAEASTTHAYNIEPELMARVKERFTDKQIVELSSVVGLFNFINRFNDSLGVLPD